jgi:hypothetical protein
MSFSSASGPLCVPSGATSQQISSDRRMDDFAGRRADRRLRRESSVHWVKPVLALAVLFLIVLVGSAPFAGAQTVHFSGGQTTVASGLNLPEGVAVDGSGNVYISDPDNSRVLNEDFSVPPSLTKNHACLRRK